MEICLSYCSCWRVSENHLCAKNPLSLLSFKMNAIFLLLSRYTKHFTVDYRKKKCNAQEWLNNIFRSSQAHFIAVDCKNKRANFCVGWKHKSHCVQNIVCTEFKENQLKLLLLTSKAQKLYLVDSTYTFSTGCCVRTVYTPNKRKCGNIKFYSRIFMLFDLCSIFSRSILVFLLLYAIFHH